MARMGNWRDNKDDEIKLDGIGGVNIMVKADVHRSGMSKLLPFLFPPLPTSSSICSPNHPSPHPLLLSQNSPTQIPKEKQMNYFKQTHPIQNHPS
jgi:hypothetical protein